MKVKSNEYIMKIHLRSVGMLIAVVLLAACSKYEEGPNLSLRSKKARVSNVWVVEYAYDLGDQVEVTADYTGESWQFTKDGVFTEFENGTPDDAGTWEFLSDKEQLSISKPGDVEIYTITRLKEKEMWIINNDEEIHLVSQQ